VVTGVKLEGNYLDKDDEFKSLVTIKPGEPTTPTRWRKPPRPSPTILATSALRLPRSRPPEIDRVNNRVALVVQRRTLAPGLCATHQCGGNNRTRDEVVRREFRQFESAWYDAERIKLSRDRVDRLGFFKDVNVETTDVPGSPDQVDLNINVAEKPTGSLQLGRRLLQRRKAGAVVQHQAGKRLRVGQLPGRGCQHQQVQPHPGFQHGRSVLHC
jgi:outer membrane protein insertion porin family